jgi:hypothetical protein
MDAVVFEEMSQRRRIGEVVDRHYLQRRTPLEGGT